MLSKLCAGDITCTEATSKGESPGVNLTCEFNLTGVGEKPYTYVEVVLSENSCIYHINTASTSGECKQITFGDVNSSAAEIDIAGEADYVIRIVDVLYQPMCNVTATEGQCEL